FYRMVEGQQLLSKRFKSGKSVVFSTMNHSGCGQVFHRIAKLAFGRPASTSNTLQYFYGLSRDLLCIDVANEILTSVGFNRWVSDRTTQCTVFFDHFQSRKQLCAAFDSACCMGWFLLGLQLCQ